MKSSGNRTVDALAKMNFEGNVTVIPHLWYEHLKKETGKTDAIAAMVLSEILYWYRPAHVKDEITGQYTGIKKRFAGDKLQKSYEQLAEQFGFSKKQIRDAVVRLEDRGIIKRDMRNIAVNGLTLSNVLYIDLFADKVEEITFHSPEELQKNRGVSTKKETPSLQNYRHPPYQNVDTYTDTTDTEITNTETTQINKSAERLPSYRQERNPKEDLSPMENETAPLDYFIQLFGREAKRNEQKFIMGLPSEWDNDLICYLLDKSFANDNQDLKIKWLASIVTDWYTKGINTLEKAKQEQSDHERKNKMRFNKQTVEPWRKPGQTVDLGDYANSSGKPFDNYSADSLGDYSK